MYADRRSMHNHSWLIIWNIPVFPVLTPVALLNVQCVGKITKLKIDTGNISGVSTLILKIWSPIFARTAYPGITQKVALRDTRISVRALFEWRLLTWLTLTWTLTSNQTWHTNQTETMINILHPTVTKLLLSKKRHWKFQSYFLTELCFNLTPIMVMTTEYIL